MPGVIDLSSVIAGMNAAESASMSGATQAGNVTEADASRRLNMSMAKSKAEDAKPLETIRKPNKGKAKWDKETDMSSKPLSRHIMDNMEVPDIASQDSLLSLMSHGEQQYALATYDLLSKGNS